MERGLFSFLVVVAFIPAVLYSANLHSQAVGKITREKVMLIEQQVLTNQENEFEYTFWAVSVNAARNGKNLEQELAEWKQFMEDQGTQVWSGAVGPDYYKHPPPNAFECLVEKSPDGKSVEIKKSTNPYSAIGTSIRAGNASTLFLIPVGCSRGL